MKTLGTIHTFTASMDTLSEKWPAVKKIVLDHDIYCEIVDGLVGINVIKPNDVDTSFNFLGTMIASDTDLRKKNE